MCYILNIFIGVLIGAGAILPGVSSGVLCVIFGIYEKLINSIFSIFKDFKKNISFLLPIMIGILIGIIVFGNILKFLFSTYHMQSCFSFIGLILGSIPILLKRTLNGNKVKLSYFISFLLAFTFGFILIIIEKHNHFYSTFSNISFLYLILSGCLMSIGIVVPGVSSSVILMLLGTYSTYLDAISCFNVDILFPMGIGVLIGGLVFLKIIKFLLNKYNILTYFAIIGFTLGSIFVLYPGFSFDINGFISLILFFLCFTLGLILEKTSS